MRRGLPGVRPWMFLSAAWLLPAITAALNEMARHRLNGDQPARLHDLLYASSDWLALALFTPAIFAVSRRWPIARPHLARRVALHLGIISPLFWVAWAAIGIAIQGLVAILADPNTARNTPSWDALFERLVLRMADWWLMSLPFLVTVYICVVGMEHAIRYFIEARDRELQMARLAEQLSGARFSALQAQLNPHFLFNTLNTIAVLVRDGEKTGAAHMVEQLSDVLRRTLSRHRTIEVTLDEELELVQQYLAIEQARFSDRLRVDLDVSETLLGAAVPSFALQHLVENAIRHGIAKHPDAGRVLVVARREHDTLMLSVTDDGPGIDVAAAGADEGPQQRVGADAQPGTGHGIENTRERLRALYGDEASLVVGNVPANAADGNDASHGTIATLRVPYRAMTQEADRATA